MMRILLALLSALAISSADQHITCLKPSVSSSYFVADDATFHFSAIFVVEFVLKCENDLKALPPLYAEVEGRLIPATLAQEGSKYQVSWTTEHEKAPAGTYSVNLHTEDSHAQLRKVQRNNGDISEIRPLFTIKVEHRGSSKGPWVQSQVLAAIIVGLVFFHAYSKKAAIQK